MEEPPLAELLRAVAELNGVGQQVAVAFERLLSQNSALVHFIRVHKAALHGVAVARGEASASSPLPAHVEDARV